MSKRKARKAQRKSARQVIKNEDVPTKMGMRRAGRLTCGRGLSRSVYGKAED